MSENYTPKLLNIVADPDPTLRVKSKPVESVTEQDVQELIQDMILTMHEEKGIGLAAIQVGIALQIIIIDTKDGPLVIINPEIIENKGVAEIAEEGCLSVPGQFGMVERDTSITMKCLNQNGEDVSYDAEGLFARVIQHEMDHLSGILFTDKITPDKTE